MTGFSRQVKTHPMPNRIGGKLFLMGLITPKELSQALKFQANSDKSTPIGQVLVELIKESHGDERAEKVREGIKNILLNRVCSTKDKRRQITDSEKELLDIACNGGCPDEARRCIVKYGADPNVRSLHPSGMTPLLKACSLGHTDIAIVLISCQADINKKDLVDNWTPMMHIIHTRNLVLLRKILKLTPCFRACNKHGEDSIEILISQANQSEDTNRIDVLMAMELIKKYGHILSPSEVARLSRTFSDHKPILNALHCAKAVNSTFGVFPKISSFFRNVWRLQK